MIQKPVWEQLTIDQNDPSQVVPKQVLQNDFICVGCSQLHWLSLDNQWEDVRPEEDEVVT